MPNSGHLEQRAKRPSRHYPEEFSLVVGVEVHRDERTHFSSDHGREAGVIGANTNDDLLELVVRGVDRVVKRGRHLTDSVWVLDGVDEVGLRHLFAEAEKGHEPRVELVGIRLDRDHDLEVGSARVGEDKLLPEGGLSQFLATHHSSRVLVSWLACRMVRHLCVHCVYQ